MIWAEIVPHWLEDIGTELGNAWPLFLLVFAVLGAGWRGTTLLRKEIHNTVIPITEKITSASNKAFEKVDDRLCKIETQLYPNGGSSLRDQLDRIGTEVRLLSGSNAEIEATTRVFFEANPQAMYRSDEHGRTIQCNQAYMDFWGFDDISEAKSNDWMNFVVDRHLAEERLASIIENPTDFKYKVPLIDGRLLYVVGHPIYVRGTFVGYIGYNFDATTPPPHHPVQEPSDEQLNI